MPYRKDLIPEYSVVTRGKNSYYITGIKDLDGKRVVLYGKTREELYKKSRAAQKSIAEMAERWKNPTVADYCARWMKAELPKLRYNTRESYRANIENYILPALGEMRLRDVTSDDVKVAMVPVTQRTSDQYQKVHMLVKRIFESAVDNDYIDSSPCRKLSARGGKPKTEREPLTDEQAKQLLRLVRGTPLYLFVMLGLYAGMRRGEILGLQWDSVYATTCEELYEKQLDARQEVEEILFRRKHPTVAEYCEKWLLMQSAKVSTATMRGYTFNMKNHIVKPLGDMYLEEVTADDIRLALIPLSKKSEGLYNTVNMLIKCIFYSAERSQLIEYNPCEGLNAKGGKAAKRKDALTDQQTGILLDTIKELPPYLFVMIGLYSGLRREEILGLQWDCVFLDESTPYISVRRAWRSEHNRPVVTTVLKTKAAKRDIPIPKCLVECLREAKAKSISSYVIADSQGEPLSYSQFQRVWKYIVVRSTKERVYYKYVNGQSIKYSVKPSLGMKQKNNPKVQYTMDFDVTPHQLRHTYITNLLYSGVDPKTVQYLAGHENSKTTMDIYAKVKYNKPEELLEVVNGAFASSDC